MAVKKKSAAKKAAPKKSAAKKAAPKKSTAKKSTAKKSAAKKSAPKRAVKKAVVKKKVTKKSTARKSTAKKTVKKSAARKKIASKVVIPPVPSVGRSRVNVSTTPAPAAPRTSAASAKPLASSKPATSPNSKSASKALFAVLLGILVVGAIVITNSNKDSDMAAPEATESAAPEATESAAPEETPAVTDATNTTGEAPSRFIGNWKDSSKSVMVITWNAPAGEVKGYLVETRANLGEWKVVSEVSATTNAAEFAKTATEGSTAFRVSAVYPDGSLGVATPFGFAGQFE
ncbi:MAG: hypothetical protein EXQ65_02960 [Candidatus Planktophila sp.]|nr:hypothetical protein [Candidatus Planktophila sp.]MSO24869.1 hypothetical protein [Candidatus Planktophila sp.]